MTDIRFTHAGRAYVAEVDRYDESEDTLYVSCVCDAGTGEVLTDAFIDGGLIAPHEQMIIDGYREAAGVERAVDDLVDDALSGL